MSLLDVRDLTVRFTTPRGTVNAVNGLSFSLERGRTLGIVGESGSGKSQSMMALMGLLAANGAATGECRFDGLDLLKLDPSALNRVRGSRIAMIFQDPMTALNPYLTVERQMTEVLQVHAGRSRADARLQALRALDAVKIPDAARRIDMHPHELSGGMRQRVMIAMALLCEPDVLVADEPTTALDVTVQAQIMGLLRDMGSELGTAIILITHDLGVVAQACEEVLVMYGGRVMEQASVERLFATASHPYTLGLLESAPRLDSTADRLTVIPGAPPDMSRPPTGCPFHPRCPLADRQCVEAIPPLEQDTAAGDEHHLRACHREPTVVRQNFHRAALAAAGAGA